MSISQLTKGTRVACGHLDGTIVAETPLSIQILWDGDFFGSSWYMRSAVEHNMNLLETNDLCEEV